MGVWIEICLKINVFLRLIVTPCMGVWIEITPSNSSSTIAPSLPVWECGLKFKEAMGKKAPVRHSLYGSVD